MLINDNQNPTLIRHAYLCLINISRGRELTSIGRANPSVVGYIPGLGTNFSVTCQARGYNYLGHFQRNVGFLRISVLILYKQKLFIERKKI